MGGLISRKAAIECLDMFLDKQCDRERTKARGFSDNDIWASVNMAYDALVAERVGKWIPIKTRPMDEEERAEWSEKLGYDIEYEYAVIYTSQLPDDGQEVLTCNRYGTISIDKFENDPDYGCSFEENGDMDGITAWMPLPEPWKGEE